MAYTGVALPEGIDMAMKLGTRHPMGSIVLGDLVGLDVCLAITDNFFAETWDTHYRALLLLRKMVRAGHLGRNTDQGLYGHGGS